MRGGGLLRLYHEGADVQHDLEGHVGRQRIAAVHLNWQRRVLRIQQQHVARCGRIDGDRCGHLDHGERPIYLGQKASRRVARAAQPKAQVVRAFYQGHKAGERAVSVDCEGPSDASIDEHLNFVRTRTSDGAQAVDLHVHGRVFISERKGLCFDLRVAHRQRHSAILQELHDVHEVSCRAHDRPARIDCATVQGTE